jgi:DNA (cytosine-5)-methyltransferase 1
LEKATIPPYDVSKFPNKWWKLDPDFPSRTLTAHLGKDTYSHIHYDGLQKRMISVREAARLQSFPDGFEFAGAMNASFRQIGNAVPPLLALAVGKALMGTLKRAISGSVASARKAA